MSKKLKLSPWHSGDVKPVHVGVYERDYGFGYKVYTYWDGTVWRASAYSLDDEELSLRDYVSPYQGGLDDDGVGKRWRGILK